MNDDIEDPITNVSLAKATTHSAASADSRPCGDPYVAALSRRPLDLFKSYAEERKSDGPPASSAQTEVATPLFYEDLRTATGEPRDTEDVSSDDGQLAFESKPELGSELMQLPYILRKKINTHLKYYDAVPDASAPYFSLRTSISTDVKRFETPPSQPETFQTAPSQPDSENACKVRQKSKLRVLFEENSLSPPRVRNTDIQGNSAGRANDRPSSNLERIDTYGFLDENDWCGQGMHVDFKKDQTVQLEDLHEILGHGSTSTVDLVKCRGIKLARKNILLRRNLKLKDVLKEVRALHELRHAHIIRLVGTYTQGRRFSMLLYPVARLNLADFLDSFTSIQKGGLISQQTSARRFWRDSLSPSSLCLVSALGFVHAHGIKHMDVKPQNVLLKWMTASEIPDSWGYKVFLCDFGISHIFEVENASQSNAYLGKTPRYAAPEVAAEEYHGRDADTFSLGCVLAEMNTVFSKRNLEDFSLFRHDGSAARLVRSSDEMPVLSTKPYHETIAQSQAWVQQLTDMAISRDIIILMLEKEPTRRPRLRTNQKQMKQPTGTTHSSTPASDPNSTEDEILHMCCPHDLNGPEPFVYDNSDGTDLCEEFSVDMLGEV